jgi:hypothetical protein
MSYLVQLRPIISTIALIGFWFPPVVGAQDTQANSSDHGASNLGNFTTESETNIAVRGSVIVVGYNSSRQAGLLGSGAWNSLSGFAYSLDGGTTFTDGGFVPSGSGQLEGDPALAFDRSGTLYYASIGTDASGISRIFVSHSTSTNPTVAFAAPVAIPGIVAATSAFQDKEFLAVDTTGGVHDGRIYVTWSEFPDQYSPNARVLFAASSSTTPLSFSSTIPLSPPGALYHGAMPVVGPAGEVYVVWGGFTSTTVAANESIHLVKSADGGATFVNPDTLDPAADKTVAKITSTIGDMFSGGIHIRTRSFPYIAVDLTPQGSPTRGNVYIVFQATPPPPTTSRSEIFLTRSTDGGVTWDTPRDISSGLAATLNRDVTPNDNWSPSISIASATGHIKVIFYSRREDAANTKVRVYEAGSTDGGVTWFNQSFSSVAFTPSTGYDSLLVPTYMGDYIQLSADASRYYAAWGDARNKCIPPSTASAPCSPAGRGDQDAFFRSESDPKGTDLFITPWGAITGSGPLWASPDIFVVDGSNQVVNAKKGIHNQLRGRIQNVGDVAATGATVRFKYAPIYVGLPDSAFKDIGSASLDIAAAGDPSGNDRKTVPADWDLTNLSDTNGGIWPQPISAFDHFCVRASAEYPGDINMSNNEAQTNFVDVSDSPAAPPFRFLIGNPFGRQIHAKLTVGQLPKGYGAHLSDISLAKPLLLRPHEIRVATVDFTRPPDFRSERHIADVVASISMDADGQTIGGLSVRLLKANAKPQPRSEPQRPPVPQKSNESQSPSVDFQSQAMTIDMPENRELVVRALAQSLKEQQQPVAQVDEKRGIVSSGSIPLKAEQIREFVKPAIAKSLSPEATGRYFISFKVEGTGPENSRVTVSSRIILGNPNADSPIGGRVVPSNGVLEKQQLAFFTQVLQQLK